jgi:KaiC/GvpD/RAD55 family RecA-like ATPase
MFKLGIRVFDEKMSALPAKSTLLFISSPGIDPAPFGISTMSNVVKERSTAVYLVNNKTPASVRREAQLLGHDLETYEDEGTFRLVDGKNPATVAQQQAGITTMVFFPRA